MDISNGWKQIILTLPDNYFFELMKNYLGKIQTPFNKHDLVDKLGSFLLKNDASTRVLGSLTETEVLILTSIEYIDRPSAKKIYNFFLKEIPFIELCDTLKTLEEKLIIYSLGSDIHISPLYLQELKEGVFNPGLLYKSHRIDPVSGRMLWLTDGLILGFLSFLFHQPDLIKSTGSFKKRAYNQIENLFPHTLTGEDGDKKLTLIRRILHNLNLVRIEEASLIPREEVWDSLLKLNKRELWLYIISASTMDSNRGLSDRITTLERVLTTIPSDRAFYPDNLKKLINAISIDSRLEDNLVLSQFIDDLLTLELLIELKDGSLTINPLLDLDNLNPDYGDKNTVILQPNFDITYKPWITLRDGYYIALFTNLKKVDLYTELSLNRESFIKGLTISSLESFKETLVRVTGAPIPENILLTLEEWESSSLRSTHYEASVLILDEDRDYILRETGAIKDLIMLNPAPGVYLIKPEEWSKAKSLLAEVDIVPVDKNHKVSQEKGSLPAYTPRPSMDITWEEKENDLTTFDNSDLETYIRNLSWSKEEKDDLRKRVKRGIIFTKEQIVPGISRTEFSEAKGVNYQGKLRLIEVSLRSTNNRLEINYVKDAEIFKEIILPQKIEKDEDKRVLHGLKLPEETPYSIDIGKISLVRRIQTTLF